MSAPRPPARSGARFGQILGLLSTFVLVSIAGGLVASGLAAPVVVGAGSVAKTGVDMFNEIDVSIGDVTQTPSQKSVILDRNGQEIAEIYAQNRQVVAHDQISDNLRQAVVAIEDKRFFDHGAIDPYGMARAFVSNASTGSTQGASTLTQQVVKNALLDKAIQDGDLKAQFDAVKPDYSRKIREAKLAIDLEKKESKDQILDDYMNLAQFGKSVYGAETASQHFFGHSAQTLSIDEAALLAGITKNPVKYDPSIVLATPSDTLTQDTIDKRTKDVTDRRDTVLYEMYTQHRITKDQYDTAKSTPVAATLHITNTPNGCSAADALDGSAYFCEYVTSLIQKAPDFFGTQPGSDARKEQLLRGGLTITTTLDLNKQKEANDAVLATVPTADPSEVNAALTSVEPGTGQIIAMAQNTRYTVNETKFGSTNINVNVPAEYGGSMGVQTGSTSKAFTLATWLKTGHSLNDVVTADKKQWYGRDFQPVTCSPPEGYPEKWPWGLPSNKTPWNVKNAEAGSGNMTVDQATYNSINTAYVAIESKLNLCDIRDTSYDMGFRRADGKPEQVVASMTLGTNETVPLIMAEAFATFANDGVHCTTVAVLSAKDSNGNELQVPKTQCNRALDSDVNAGAVSAMKDVVSKGTAAGKVRLGVPVAGKTGTANDDMQSWFVGYTKHLATAAWVGTGLQKADGTQGKVKPMIGIRIKGKYYSNVYGAVLAAPMFNMYMQQATAGDPPDDFTAASSKQLYGDQVTIPNVVGQTADQAQATLSAAGFASTVNPTVIDSTSPAGTVAQQDPAAGTQAFKSQSVTLYLSSGNPPAVNGPAPTANPADQLQQGNGNQGNGNGNGPPDAKQNNGNGQG